MALSSISPVVEAADGEEGTAYLDAHGLERLWGDPVAVARHSLRALRACGMVARAGAGPTRTVALALARRMPAEGLCGLQGEEARAFLHRLPLTEPVLGLPAAEVAALDDLGIRTLGALGDLPAAGLTLRFGPAVLRGREAALRLEDAPLRPWTLPLHLEVDARLDGGVADRVVLERLLDDLAARLAAQLARRASSLAVLRLVLTCEGGATHIAQERYWPPLHDRRMIALAARDLVARARLRAPVEQVSLRALDVGGVQPEQAGLWEGAQSPRRDERLAATLRAHARRHGQTGVRRLRRDPLSRDGWSWDEVEPGP